MALPSNTSSYRNYETRNRNPNPAKCALLVIDMQNYFSEIAIPIIPTLNTTINLCRSKNIPIIFTRHCHKSPSDYAMLGEWCNNDLLFDGTTDTELISGLACNLGADRVIEKSTYSAFYGTGLEELLKGMGIEEVIICGVMTNVCCETSARAAFVSGFRVFFSTDATAGYDEVLHEATLKNMAFGFAYLVDCNRLECAFRDP